MAYIPGTLTPTQVRYMMFYGALLFTPAGGALVVTAPWGRFTAIGLVVAAGGLCFLYPWWQMRPGDPGARRLQAAGALLTLAVTVLLELALFLSFDLDTDSSPAAFVPTGASVGAAAACAIARIIVGLKARNAARLTAAAGPGQGGHKHRGPAEW